RMSPVTATCPARLISRRLRGCSSNWRFISSVPSYRLINTCTRGRYQIEKTIVTDPERDVIVQRIRFRPLVGTLESYRVFALLAPHIGNQGFGNDAWCDEYKGIPMLFAQRADVSLALVCNCDWRVR